MDLEIGDTACHNGQTDNAPIFNIRLSTLNIRLSALHFQLSPFNSPLSTLSTFNSLDFQHSTSPLSTLHFQHSISPLSTLHFQLSTFNIRLSTWNSPLWFQKNSTPRHLALAYSTHHDDNFQCWCSLRVLCYYYQPCCYYSFFYNYVATPPSATDVPPYVLSFSNYFRPFPLRPPYFFPRKAEAFPFLPFFWKRHRFFWTCPLTPKTTIGSENAGLISLAQIITRVQR